jgi:hypothetical protein
MPWNTPLQFVSKPLAVARSTASAPALDLLGSQKSALRVTRLDQLLGEFNLARTGMLGPENNVARLLREDLSLHLPRTQALIQECFPLRQYVTILQHSGLASILHQTSKRG